MNAAETTGSVSDGILTLGDVLLRAKSFRWNEALFIDGKPPFDSDSPAAILDPDDSEDPDTDPDFAIQNGLRYALSVQDVQDIVENAALQKRQLNLDDLVRAFNYYFEHDAFITF